MAPVTRVRAVTEAPDAEVVIRDSTVVVMTQPVRPALEADWTEPERPHHAGQSLATGDFLALRASVRRYWR